MSKAILIIDMPSSCDVCPLFCPHYSDMSCRANGRGINYPYPKEVRQDWCPLKPMPQKIGTEEALKMPRNGCLSDVINSYNACIDEILGGSE